MNDTKQKRLLTNRRGNLNIRGRIVSTVIGAMIGWYVTGPIVQKIVKKVG